MSIGDWVDGARNWTRDRLADIDAGKQWVGEKIDGAVDTAEQAVDDFRDGIVDFGRENGGVVGETVAQGVSSTIGLAEGVVLGAYDMGKGVVQLADGLGHVISPVEWAVNGERNLQRVETAATAVSAIGNLANPVSWVTNTEANVQTAGALWDGVTASYQQAAADGDYAEIAGRLVFDVGSMFIGVGEANAALKGTQGANAIARIGEGARALDTVGDASRALDVLGDAGRVADPLADATRVADPLADATRVGGTADDAARAAAALDRAEAAVRGGDIALAGRTVDEQAAAVSALSNAGRVEEARALLKPFLDSGDFDGLIARLDVSTPAGGTYFWSGNAQEAGRVAEAAGGRTLETTAGGRILDQWSDIPAWNDGGQQVWSAASSKFAAGASGDITVVVTRAKATTQGGDVWRTVESPIVANMREAGVVGDIRVIVIDPVNPAKLVPLTGIAAERALEAEGLLSE